MKEKPRQRSVTDILNFPTLAGHLWFMYPLISLYLLHTRNIAMAEKPRQKKKNTFFIGLFLLSTCIPYLNRWCGEVWGQCFWNEIHHMLCGTSLRCQRYLVLAHYIHVISWNRSNVSLWNYFNGRRAILTIYSFYVQTIRKVLLHPK